ncbi:MAG TPA: sugar phosphate isomerase/epimerase [Caldilineaceae bacterium]|nr:sugar phosphate isomerase/epimerase [Caldilineaceae bacterium]
MKSSSNAYYSEGYMVNSRNIKFATDLVTFYDPKFWGMSGGMDALRTLFSSGGWTPLRFWNHILTSAKEAGLDGIEITFPPGDWHSAEAAYGSAAGFAQALTDHGLELCSGYFSNRIPGTNREADFTDPADQTDLLQMAAGYAEFLATCGADSLLVSLPLRTSRNASPPRFVDLATAAPIADTLNRMAAATLQQGVKLALHPEAFSMFRNSRDVDLFMLLTDPSYVFLCPDTAQFTVAGSDPLAITERHKDRLTITHWKDATGAAPADVPIDETIYDRQIQWFAPVGEGVVDWSGWLRLLRDLNFQGWAVLELDAAPDPVGDLQRIRAYIDGALLHIYR